jgi:uncharacterized protein (DUF1330 family)
LAENTTLVVTAMPNPEEAEAMQSYIKAAGPMLAEAGGQLVKRLKVQGSITGKPPHGMVLVMEFEDKAKLEAMFASDAYAALIPAREKGFSSINICYAGEF